MFLLKEGCERASRLETTRALALAEFSSEITSNVRCSKEFVSDDIKTLDK